MNTIITDESQIIKRPMKGEINLTINNTFPDNLDVKIFSPLIGQDHIFSHFFLNPSLSTDGLKQLLTQSILAGTGNVNGVIGFDSNGTEIIKSNDGLKAISISSEKYPYYSLLEFLKTREIFITRVRLSSNNAAQVKSMWFFTKSYPNGKTKSTPLDLSQVIMPNQVNPLISEFMLNRTIDKFTGITIQMLANTSLSITFDFTSKVIIEE